MGPHLTPHVIPSDATPQDVELHSSTMRTLLVASLLAVSTLATAASQRALEKAANDDQLLAAAGVEPERAQVRTTCSAAVVDTDERPNFFNCVYVQTPHAVNILTLEGGYLMSEQQLTLASMDGVALQNSGKYTQLQIFSGHKVTALYIYNDSWIDKEQTEAVYNWLVSRGVQRREPRAWLGP
jgi:hypothetical protein